MRKRPVVATETNEASWGNLDQWPPARKAFGRIIRAVVDAGRQPVVTQEEADRPQLGGAAAWPDEHMSAGWRADRDTLNH